jgi:hypothetical protein
VEARADLPLLIHISTFKNYLIALLPALAQGTVTSVPARAQADSRSFSFAGPVFQTGLLAIMGHVDTINSICIANAAAHVSQPEGVR